MAAKQQMFTVDKFLGINEAVDEITEMKMGEASRMENFFVTDDFNLTLRPGVRRAALGDRTPARILASWSGFVDDRELFVLCDFDGSQDRLWVCQLSDSGSFTLVASQSGALGLTQWEDPCVKIFAFAGQLYVMSRVNTVYFTGEGFSPAEYYVPLVITGAAPTGGGTTLENLNMLTSLRRMEFSADGEAVTYVLPEEAEVVTQIQVDNESLTVSEAGSFDAASHTFTFTEAPAKGVANVMFTYDTDAAATEQSRLRLARMRLAETYNGSTDTRLFLAGDGSNLCFYTGVPMSGDLSELYFPAMNEIAVDMSDSPITGMVRHYSKLLIFKPDGTFSISYEPVTLTDGSTIAGFFLRNINREFGSDVLGQVQTVNNYPRTLSKGGVVEWRITSSYYRDERYAKQISAAARRTLAKADISGIVTCDDNYGKTYYLFLNDGDGTVLVNRYALTNDGIWCVYRGGRFRAVRSAWIHRGALIFCSDTEVFSLDDGLTKDAPETDGGDYQQIKAVWESGYQAFGADFRRKYSSILYISILPKGRTALTVTASTDRRETYMEKVLSQNLFSWSTVTWPTWTFSLNAAPRIQRVRLKVKKFVYYKLIFKVEEPGAKATILGYDQQVRYSSMEK